MVSADSQVRLFDKLKQRSNVSAHLYLVRHGQTAGNVNHQLIGHTDMPLDELGVRQAEQVGVRMRSVPLDAIVSSPLQRARITANQIALHQRFEPTIDHRLIEMNFGHVEGLTIAEACVRYPEIVTLRDDPLNEDFAWPGGDVRTRFHANVLATITDLAITWQNQHVAIVCHGGVIGSIMAQLDGGSPNDYATYPVANCSVTHLEVHGAGTTAHLLNDITHLEVVRTEPFTYAVPAQEPADAPTRE